MKENEETREYVSTKEQNKSPETNHNEAKIRDLFNVEFKRIVMKMLTKVSNA